MEERIAKLEAENAELRKRNAELMALVEKLQAQLGLDSRNSHKAPSSDPPATKAERNKRKRQRKAAKRGPKDGHKGHHRVLLPQHEVEIQALVPTQCEHCQHHLEGHDPQPQRHQVTEIPPLAAVTVEYQLHKLKCSKCHKHTRARLPDGVGRSNFGPRLKAAVCALTGSYRLSKDQTVALLGDLFGISMSPGTLINIETQGSELLAEAYGEAEAFVREAQVVHMDETGWRMNRHSGWMWVMVSGVVRVFCIGDERTQGMCQDMLDDFDGVLVSDRYSAYSWYPLEKRQFCWAHLHREFKAMSARSGLTGKLGRKLHNKTSELFRCWARVRDGTLERKEGLKQVDVLRTDIETLLSRGQVLESKPFGGMCRRLCEEKSALWTFTRHQGIPLTNNAAERALRPAVIWRKLSFGNDSVKGSFFTERILTVAQTLKAQARSTFDFLVKAFEAPLFRRPLPKLLPAPA